MKIRTGFVSNSSSSSFVLCVSKDSTKKEIRFIIEKEIGNIDDFFIPNFKQKIIDLIMDCEKISKDELEDYKKYLPFDQNRIDTNLDVYRGSFHDDTGDPIENLLCETSFKIKEENLFIENFGRE